MGCRVFLDIGAHVGETLTVALDRRWRFDRIECFEPAPSCWPRLDELADERVTVHRFGLSDTDATVDLYDAGTVGASTARRDGTATPCEFRDAGEWFAQHLADGAEVFAKINVEGAEVDIIERLAETGQLAKIDHLLIHFDVRKIPGREHREADGRRLLAAAAVDWIAAEDIEFGGVYRGTRNWLLWAQSRSRGRDLRYKVLRRQEDRLRRALHPVKQLVRPT